MIDVLILLGWDVTVEPLTPTVHPKMKTITNKNKTCIYVSQLSNCLVDRVPATIFEAICKDANSFYVGGFMWRWVIGPLILQLLCN